MVIVAVQQAFAQSVASGEWARRCAGSWRWLTGSLVGRLTYETSCPRDLIPER